MTSDFYRYRAAAAVLAPRAQIWRLPFGVIFAFGGQAVATPAIFMAIALVASLIGDAHFDSVLNRLAALGGPGPLVAVLSTFLGIVLGVALAMKLLHGRGPRILLSWSRRFDWGDFARAALVYGGLGVAAVIASLPFQDYVPNLPPASWALWLLPALLVTFVQVFAEELVFRGYLQAHLAARFARPVIWIGLPSLLFGAMHLPNAAVFGANGWLVLLAPMLIGAIAAHLTARTGGIGAATGLHFANNCLGLLIVAVPGPFGALALYLHPIDIADVATVRPMILTNLAMILVAYPLCLRATRPWEARIA
ncbi:MAG TPA: CPBP family intramembrane glutamic endopeptidase [Paracoccaceae bacterium]|nr:CPBP family intramembrane glutamic endopeptidase [Paracoccaceae bacterium]